MTGLCITPGKSCHQQLLGTDSARGFLVVWAEPQQHLVWGWGRWRGRRGGGDTLLSPPFPGNPEMPTGSSQPPTLTVPTVLAEAGQTLGNQDVGMKSPDSRAPRTHCGHHPCAGSCVHSGGRAHRKTHQEGT